MSDLPGSQPSDLMQAPDAGPTDRIRVVADLGNSRLKWARLHENGELSPSVSLPLDDESAWKSQWEAWNPANHASSTWGIASVNPHAAQRLRLHLENWGAKQRWVCNATPVPLLHRLTSLEATGADRALAVFAVQRLYVPKGLTVVVLCGTAITVERITADGVWQGGAIAIGLGMASRALHGMTAQLPLVRSDNEPRGWGDSTEPALQAGIYWGVVGGVRELLVRQSTEMPIERILWSGGDASTIASTIGWDRSEVVPDLVLLGLAELVFRRGT